MSFSKMNTFIDIVLPNGTIDSEGFATNGDVVLASLRAYKEDRYGNESWKNRASFSSATALFRLRKRPGLKVTTAMAIVCEDGRYNILSVEDIKNRGMYIELLAEKLVESRG